MKTEGKASVQPVYTRESCHPGLASSKTNKEILTTWHHRPAQRLQNTAAHLPPGHKLLSADATDHAFAASAWHTTRRCYCQYSVKGFNYSGAQVVALGATKAMQEFLHYLATDGSYTGLCMCHLLWHSPRLPVRGTLGAIAPPGLLAGIPAKQEERLLYHCVMTYVDGSLDPTH